MRRFLTGMTVVSLMAVLTAGCSSEDDDALSDPDNEAEADDDGGDGDGGSGGDGGEYAEAIAFASQQEDPGDESDIAFSPDAADCYGQAFVDVVGLDELEANVTPDEIRDNPQNNHDDWGIEVTQEQGVEIFRQLVDCQPEVLEEFGTAMSEAMNEGTDTPIDVDVECLADVDPSAIEEFMGAAVAADSDDVDPTPEQARAVVDWIAGCADLKSVMIDALAAESGFPPEAIACLEEGLSDELVREIFVTGFTSAPGDDFEDTPAGEEFTEVISRCATQGGG